MGALNMVQGTVKYLLKLWVASSCGQERFHAAPQCTGSSIPVIPRAGVSILCVITKCTVE